MTLKKIIEKLRVMKSDLDNAFDEGRIDLDGISSGLEEAAASLESLERSLPAERPVADSKSPSGSSAKTASKTQTVDVADYR